MNELPTTVFLDIDGTLLHQERHVCFSLAINEKPKLIEGTLEKLLEWDRKGYQIVLTTGRRECWREVTERQLRELGVFYDQLIMQIGSGRRVIINDRKPTRPDDTAIAVNLERNKGIRDVPF